MLLLTLRNLPLTFSASLSLVKPPIQKTHGSFVKTSLLLWGRHTRSSQTTKLNKLRSTAPYNRGYSLCQQAGQKPNPIPAVEKILSGPQSLG